MRDSFKMFLLVVLILVIGQSMTYAYDAEDVHPWINERAAYQSGLDNTLIHQLGFSEGLKTIFQGREAVEWIRKGGTDEDGRHALDLRYLQHFHDPLKPWGDAGLKSLWESSLLWAQNYYYNLFSWNAARHYYYEALTTGSEASYAQTFLSLGQVMHLVADASVPAHVRDDGHGLGDSYESWAQENVPIPYSSISIDPSIFSRAIFYSSVPVPISALWDQDSYTGANPPDLSNLTVGLAEYTNANFFSNDTIFVDYPYPAVGVTNLFNIDWKHPEIVDAGDGQFDGRIYIWKLCGGVQSYRLAAAGYLLYDCIQEGHTEHYPLILDDTVHEDYAAHLVPRAVGYNAALLDYFFRGRLEITAPDAYVYSIVDGSKTVVVDEIEQQVFNTIKAKVRNITPEKTPFDEEIQTGTIQAVAKYKKRTDYQPDLSADPPIAPTSREQVFSYSLSAPIAISSLSSTDPTDFEFDFSENPIPAGITDLSLLVIFKGTLWNEKEIAIAVGMKDLNEPTHVTLMNCTDRFYLDGVLRTAEEIRSDPALKQWILCPCPTDPDALCECLDIDPHNVHMEVGFYSINDTFKDYQARYLSMPPGRYGKVIILTDEPLFYMRVHVYYDDPSEDLVWMDTGTSVTNQEKIVVNQQGEEAPRFFVSAIYSFRGIDQHEWAAYTRFFPDTSGISIASWPDLEDGNKEPVAAYEIIQ